MQSKLFYVGIGLMCGYFFFRIFFVIVCNARSGKTILVDCRAVYMDFQDYLLVDIYKADETDLLR